MKILLAHNGSGFCDAAVDSLRRAGLSDDATALVLCADGERSLAEATAQKIRSTFPSWHLKSEALDGLPAEVILHISRSWRPDLLIIGSNALARDGSNALARDG
jgi:hypothetical protein